MKTSITQIWMICHVFPFAKVGQNNDRIDDDDDDNDDDNDYHMNGIIRGVPTASAI